MSNESDLYNRAYYDEKQASEALREAQRALDRTPRSENLAATRARDEAKRTHDQAVARLREAEAKLRRH